MAVVSESDNSGKVKVVMAFYEALRAHDAGRIEELLAADEGPLVLEWWFHGRPQDQHLMSLLSGARSWSSSSAEDDEFVFEPVYVQSIGDQVFVEGESKVQQQQQQQQRKQHGGECKCWVHVWTVKGARIVELREYFDTSLTVLNQTSLGSCNSSSSSNSSSSRNSSSRSATTPVWQSQLGHAARKSMPSLILAI
jgi:ketosteroid isomerase-like protein